MWSPDPANPFRKRPTSAPILAERLPDYMVPSAFVPDCGDSHQRNGKLDEKALPSPETRDEEYTGAAHADRKKNRRAFRRSARLGSLRCN